MSTPTRTPFLQHYTLDPLYSTPVNLFIYTILSLVNFEDRRGNKNK